MGQQHLVLHHHALLAHVAAGTHLGAIHQHCPGAAGAPLVQVDIAEFEHAILKAVRLETTVASSSNRSMSGSTTCAKDPGSSTRLPTLAPIARSHRPSTKVVSKTDITGLAYADQTI